MLGKCTTSNSFNIKQTSFKGGTPKNELGTLEAAQVAISDAVDTIVKKVDEEKKKKSTKTAIGVGSSVLILSTLVALLNPKISPKTAANLRKLTQENILHMLIKMFTKKFS